MSRLLIDVRPAVGSHGERGIGRYVRGLASGIERFPDELRDRVWALGEPGATLDSFQARGVVDTAPPGFRRLPGWLLGRGAMGRALARSGAHVVHATDPQRPWRAGGVASIVTVYDLIPLRDPETLRSWRLDHQARYRWYLRQVRSAARVLAISRTTADDVETLLGVPSGRIDVVYPSVVAPAEATRDRSGHRIFLVVGALDPHKRPELALRAFAAYRSGDRDSVLRFIGPGDAIQRGRLRELAARLGVGDAVSIDGRLSEAALESAFMTSAALISTSRIEGFGLPPVEAAIRGVPVIAVDTAAARETMSGVGLLVPPDVEAISEAMRQPRELSAADRARLRDRFGVERGSAVLAEVYRRILA